MARAVGMTRIDPASPVYREVARLYRIAQELRPGGHDLWNGELYSRTDDKLGGLARDKSLRLHEDYVLKHLTGGESSHDPQRQSQAVATVLHEALHARVEKDAAQEPNAVRDFHSIGLDEGLTELATMEDFAEFAERAGYRDTHQPKPMYAGAVHATRELLDRASSSDAERTELLKNALDQPVAMRWDAVANNIVRNELADTVPSETEHQQAARAHLVNQMAVDGWVGIEDRPEAGPVVVDDMKPAVDRGVADIQNHYTQNPGEPYPVKYPNQEAVVARGLSQDEQHRASSTPDRGKSVDLSKLPPPQASTRVTAVARTDAAPTSSQPGVTQADRAQTEVAPSSLRAGGQHGDPTRFLNNQAPAAHATRPGPSLGDGARGAGAPTGPSVNRPTPARTTTPDRGSRT